MPEGVTRACLDNPQVLRNISKDDGDDDAMLMWAIQAANDRAIHALKQAGYAAEHLQATLQQGDAESDWPITQPNTLARPTAGARKCTWSWRSLSCDGWDARHIRRCVYLNGDEHPK